MPIWYSVANKVLRRGELIPLSSLVQEKLTQLLGPLDDLNPQEYKNAFVEASRFTDQRLQYTNVFDSSEEQSFWDDILPAIFPTYLLGYWWPQVQLGSFTGELDHAQSGQRVDFCFAYPGRIPIVVEIDGEQHKQTVESDKERDEGLRRNNIDVIRIAASDVRDGNLSAFELLKKLADDLKAIEPSKPSRAASWILAGRRIHQVQVCLLDELMRHPTELLAQEAVMVEIQCEGKWGSKRIEEQVLQLAVEDLNELLIDIASGVGSEQPPVLRCGFADIQQTAIQIAVGMNSTKSSELSIASRYFPAQSLGEVVPSTHWNAGSVDREACRRLLDRIFGFDDFREGQFEAIERSLKGEDTLVLLPTGSGKSVAFQMSGLLRPGVMVTVDPTIALIEDQIQNLKLHGISRVAMLSSKQSVEQRELILRMLSMGQYIGCYLAPERFQSTEFRESLRGLTANTPVSILAVDEAHCVSEWGHDFRPAYLNLARVAREYCAYKGEAPPIMGLTGTASRSVLKDVQRELVIPNPDAVIVPKTFDRPELHFQAISCSSAEKPSRLEGVMRGLPSHFGVTPNDFFVCNGLNTFSGLVFCPWVGGDHGVVKVADDIGHRLSIPAHAYGSKTQPGYSTELWDQTIRTRSEDFKRNKVPVMASTKAFGMGIDKPNIRYTIHYNIPASIESFYQEAGRAGRDAEDAMCIILYSDDHPERTERLLNPAMSTVEQLKSAVDKAGWDNSDDITRALFFHQNSFKGFDSDYMHLIEILSVLGKIEDAGRVTLRCGTKRDFSTHSVSQDVKTAERSLHRLVSIGVVSDYTIDHSKNELQVLISGATKYQLQDSFYRYLSAYQRPRARKAVQELVQFLESPYVIFVQKMCEYMIHFVYEVIERGRRQALADMLRICKQGHESETIRAEMLMYLERSKFAESIEEVLTSDDAGLALVGPVLEEVRSALDAAELRGECSRELQAYPDHPTLRLLRAGSEALCSDPVSSEIALNIEAALGDGVSKYGLDLKSIYDAVLAIAEELVEGRLQYARLTLQVCVDHSTDPRETARYFMGSAQSKLFEIAQIILLENVRKNLLKVTRSNA